MKKYVDLVIDDAGMHWRYSYPRSKIYCTEAEEEIINNPDSTPTELNDNGYYCDSLEDGIELLKEYGYIAD